MAGFDRFRTSSAIDYERTTTNASDGSINRYYDPATASFLSVDPMVSVTQHPRQGPWAYRPVATTSHHV